MGVKDVTIGLIVETYKEKLRANGGFNFIVFKDLVRDLALQFRQAEGRYYVLLCLDEAEHFRGIMHGRHGRPLLPSEEKVDPQAGLTCAALWMKGDSDMKLLQSSYGYVPAPDIPQYTSMVNSYSFLDSDMSYSDSQLTVLLRILEANTPDERRKWFMEIRSCRRRRQIDLKVTLPVVTIFTIPHEYQFMQYKSEVARIQYEMRERGMLVFDAFRAFNSSNTGLLTCSELYGGMEFLGIPFTPEQIYDLMRKLAIDNEVVLHISIFSSQISN
jgi:hypothetical protein